jgi:hypothetical protein
VLVRSAALIIRGEFYYGKWFVVYNNSQRTAMDWIGTWHHIVFIVVLVEKMVDRQADEQRRGELIGLFSHQVLNLSLRFYGHYLL